MAQALDLAGDRLLVDKNVFQVRSPRRWELAVFRCPVDDSTPYVKRVAGLPGEQVRILGGDLFINGEIARKTLRELREQLVPVFDQAFEPKTGWADRWSIEMPPPVGLLNSKRTMERPPTAAEYQSGVLTLDGATRPVTVAFRNRSRDSGRDETVMDAMAYNAGTGVGRNEPVHDFLVSFDLTWQSGSGSVQCQLTDGEERVRLNLPLGIDSPARIETGRTIEPMTCPVPSLQSGRTYRIEFAFVDRRILLAIDGREVPVNLELPADPSEHGRRNGVTRPVQFTVQGATVTVSRFQLFRDTHYRSDGANGIDTPYRLNADEYYVLGDNSANSRDSRVWRIPAVPRTDFIGKPFLIHQPLKLGRMPLNGQERTYPTVDWSRLRWVR
jgi:signal peptidase I